ncbi:MAG: hypothetical protein ACI8XG_001921 [Congregibacter sp.]|jgi:hypothetical protein
MSCLTRKMQHKLTRYLQQHNEIINGENPENVRFELMSRGLCPTDVTIDQVKAIIRSAQGC